VELLAGGLICGKEGKRGDSLIRVEFMFFNNNTEGTSKRGKSP